MPENEKQIRTLPHVLEHQSTEPLQRNWVLAFLHKAPQVECLEVLIVP